MTIPDQQLDGGLSEFSAARRRVAKAMNQKPPKIKAPGAKMCPGCPNNRVISGNKETCFDCKQNKEKK